jgi:hypothetical protein
MPRLVREKLDKSLATLQQVLLSRQNLAVRLPPTDDMKSAIRFLGERYQVLPEFDDVLHSLEQSPPLIGDRLVTVSKLLIERAGEVPHMTIEEIEADKKTLYMRSTQYDLEGPINWTLFIASIAAASYLAVDLGSRQLTNDHLIKILVSCSPVAIAMPFLLKPRKGTSVFDRFLKYRAISRQYGMSYQEWLAGHGRGADVRITRRQGLLFSVLYVIAMTIYILEYSPAG